MVHRTAVGIALVCALVFCAIAAQSASAAEGKNTTAFECVKGGGEKDFSDAHCDNHVEPGKGEFGHVVLNLNEKVSIAISNEKTKNETKEAASTVLKGTIAGLKSEIVCKTVTGTGNLTNEEPTSKVHRVKGTVEAKFTSCTAPKPAFGCKVKEPITVSSNVEGVEGLGAEKTRWASNSNRPGNISPR